MSKHIIVGVHIVDRKEHAEPVQKMFTKYGAQITTRLGLHDTICPENGLILLEMQDNPDTYKMIEEISAIDGVDIQSMTFKH